MPKLIFYPIGNADSSLIHLADNRLLLFDYCNASGNDENKCIALDAELRAYLKDQRRQYFDVVMFTHADGDHVQGAENFFWFDHAEKYKGDGRIVIKELWVPACFILDDDPCESARVIRQEARGRLKEGSGIRVFGNPGVLDNWLWANGINPASRAHLVTHAGTCVPGFNQYNGQVEIFCHSPFSARLQDDPRERNGNSIVLHLTFFEQGREVHCMMGADAEHQAWVDIVKITEAKGHHRRLEWDLFHISHHCSYTGISPIKGTVETIPREEIAKLFDRGSANCIVVSPSKPIPAMDTDQPPHRQTAAFYRRVVREKGRESNFVVTMEWPSVNQPRPIVVEVSSNGLTIKKDYTAIAGIATVTRTPSPRFG